MLKNLDVYSFSTDEMRVLTALCDEENALDVADFTAIIKIEPERILVALDSLVKKAILQADMCYAKSEQGTLVYMFVDNELSQYIYNHFVPDSEG